MSHNLNRRRFLQQSALATSASALAFRCEEQNLLAQSTEPSPARKPAQAKKTFPQAKLGNISVSRLICGGNLMSGFAHARDLIYVSPLLKHYFTDEKVFETLHLVEEEGINTAILRIDDNTHRILKKYWNEMGGKLQWIAQAKITDKDMTDIKRAVDRGAVACYVHGGVGDQMVEKGQVDVLGKALDLIKQNKLVSGLAGHSIQVIQASEEEGLAPDFYMKTFNSKRYWSAGPLPRNDSVWAETPNQTRALMAEIDRPWIAYKVLGAGAIHPREGFQYAYQHGADFICAGMFDFQVAENARIARQAIKKTQMRERPWWI